MAELSAETQSIIDRLKAEGDLIRNSGTNSVKSLNIKLQKFDGLFSAINTNIAMQTEIMQSQLGLSQEAVEAARTRAQFDEVSNKTSDNSKKSVDDKENKKSKSTDEKIEKMGNSIAESISGFRKAFTLKNMAMGAAGAFAGYNLLKGFIDESTGGGFTTFESNLGNMFTGLGTFDFESLTVSLSGMKTSFESIGESLTSLAAALDVITNIDWLTVAALITGSIGTLTILGQSMRLMNNAIELRAARGALGSGRPRGRAGLFRKLLGAGLGVAFLRNIFGGDPDLDAAERARVSADAPRANPHPDITPRPTPNRVPISKNWNTGVPISITPPNIHDGAPRLPPPNINIIDAGNGHIKYQNMADGGKFMRNADALSALGAAGLGPDGLPRVDLTPRVAPPQLGRGRGNGQMEVDTRRARLNVAQASASAGELVLAEKRGLIKRLAASKIGKVILQGVPIVGAIAGLGFAAWNLLKGDFTSAALNVASIPLPTLSGSAIDIGAMATEIFYAVTGENYNQFDEADRAIMIGIAEECKLAYDEWMSDKQRQKQDHFNSLPDDYRSAIESSQERVVGGQRGPSSIHNPDTGGMSLGSYNGAPDNTLNQSSSFLGGYYSGPGGVLMWQGRTGPAVNANDELRRHIRRLQMQTVSPTQDLSMINAPMISPISAPITVTTGASSVNSVTYQTASTGGPSVTVFGLTGALS